MLTLGSLLARGYLPGELPPALTSSHSAAFIASNPVALPQEFQPNSTIPAVAGDHNVARLGISRRQMSIPNPIPFTRLCREVVNAFGQTQAHCATSTITRSMPIENPATGRAIVAQYDFPHLIDFRSRLRSTSRFVLKTDIAKFYPSIYTHCIPWALHGKATAKAQRGNMALLGNVLDKCVRNCQDKQTVGVPIGPDTSLLAAEIVLSAADAKLIALVPRVNGFRYVDDYEFGTQTYAQAEELLATLQEVLKEYELELNFDKTKIVPLPIPLDSSWVSELGNFEFGASPGRERRDLVHYFTRAVELAHLNQTDFVLKYSIARLRSVDLFPSNWILVQEFLLQCVMVESATFRPVLEQLMHAKYHGMPVDKALLGEAMDFCIIQHSRTGHGSEVAWALWALVVWSVPLSQEATRAVSRMEDPVVALLALDAETRGLTPGGLDKTTWQSFMTAGDLLDRQWLLAYEANVKGWLPTVGGGDHVAAHPAFGVLKQAGVSFYDPALLLTYVPSPRPRAGIRYAPYSLVQVEG